jgi:hypothetical protein
MSVLPNESLQSTGDVKHPDERAFSIASRRRYPHIELTARN